MMSSETSSANDSTNTVPQSTGSNDSAPISSFPNPETSTVRDAYLAPTQNVVPVNAGHNFLPGAQPVDRPVSAIDQSGVLTPGLIIPHFMKKPFDVEVKSIQAQNVGQFKPLMTVDNSLDVLLQQSSSDRHPLKAIIAMMKRGYINMKYLFELNGVNNAQPLAVAHIRDYRKNDFTRLSAEVQSEIVRDAYMTSDCLKFTAVSGVNSATINFIAHSQAADGGARLFDANNNFGLRGCFVVFTPFKSMFTAPKMLDSNSNIQAIAVRAIVESFGFSEYYMGAELVERLATGKAIHHNAKFPVIGHTSQSALHSHVSNAVPQAGTFLSGGPQLASLFASLLQQGIRLPTGSIAGKENAKRSNANIHELNYMISKEITPGTNMMYVNDAASPTGVAICVNSDVHNAKRITLFYSIPGESAEFYYHTIDWDASGPEIKTHGNRRHRTTTFVFNAMSPETANFFKAMAAASIVPRVHVAVGQEEDDDFINDLKVYLQKIVDTQSSFDVACSGKKDHVLKELKYYQERLMTKPENSFDAQDIATMNRLRAYDWFLNPMMIATGGSVIQSNAGCSSYLFVNSNKTDFDMSGIKTKSELIAKQELMDESERLRFLAIFAAAVEAVMTIGPYIMTGISLAAEAWNLGKRAVNDTQNTFIATKNRADLVTDIKGIDLSEHHLIYDDTTTNSATSHVIPDLQEYPLSATTNLERVEGATAQRALQLEAQLTEFLARRA